MNISLVLVLALVATSVAFQHSLPALPYFNAACGDLTSYYGVATPGLCLVTSEHYGPTNDGDDTVSDASCPPGEFVTYCECVITIPHSSGAAHCDGIMVSNDMKKCTARGALNGGEFQVRVICGRLTGTGIVKYFPLDSTPTNAVDPEVSCDPGQRLIGCYVHTYFSENYLLEARPVIDGLTCKTYTGCNKCRVQAVCHTPGVEEHAEYCPCTRTVSGDVVHIYQEESKATCTFPGEKVTHCECERLVQNARAQGARHVITPGVVTSNYCVCAAGPSTESGEEGVRARACCGRLAGKVSLVQSSNYPANGPNPTVSCPAGEEFVSCYVQTFNTHLYPDAESHLKTVIDHGASTCSAPNCDDCHMTAMCLDRTEVCTENGGWEAWNPVTACTASCGGGTRTEDRRCTVPEPKWAPPALKCLYEDKVTRGLHEIVTERPCNTSPCPIHGDWLPWKVTVPCDVSCGGGGLTRFRECKNPTPRHGGRKCLRELTNTRGLTEIQVNVRCNTNPCPVPGDWGDWYETRACASCLAEDTHEDSRNCNNPPPKHGGTCTRIDGSTGLDETRNADCSFFCPVNGGWNDWYEFEACTVSCSGGTKVEERKCENPIPLHGGNECELEDGTSGLCEKRTEDCNTQACPRHGTIQFMFSIGAISEADGLVTVAVKRTDGTDGTVSVDYFTEDETALDGSDYTSASGTLTFLDGQDRVDKGVFILQNDEEEPTETFKMYLHQPQGGVVIGSTDIITISIEDDDVNGGWADYENVEPCSVSCGGGSQKQRRRCTNPAPQGGGARCITESEGLPSDVEEKYVDCNEQECPGTVQFTDSTTSVAEGGGSVTLSLIRTDGTNGAFSVSWGTGSLSATIDEDYTDGDGIVEFLDGETSKTISVSIIDDDEDDGDETFEVVLGNPTGGAQIGAAYTVVVTIIDDDEHGGWGPWSVSEACTVSCGGGDEVQTRLCNEDPPQGGGSECPLEDGTFGLIETKTVPCNTAECPGTLEFEENAYVFLEIEPAAVLTVKRTGGANGVISVDWGLIAYGVTLGQDYSGGDAGTIQFSPGQTTQTIVIPLKDDLEEEGDESFTVHLENPTGGALLGANFVASVLIHDNDVHGGWGAWEVTQACSVSCGGGVESQTRYCDNPVPEGGGLECEPESGPRGLMEVKAQVPCNEQECPGTVQFTSSTFSFDESAGTAYLTLTRTDGANGDVVVDWLSTDLTAANADYIGGSGEILFLDSETSKTLEITISDDALDEGDETFQIQLANPQGGVLIGSPSLTVITIVDDDEHGEWGLWEITVECSVSCGQGLEERTRHCDPPQGSGNQCQLEDGSYGLIEVVIANCFPEVCPNPGTIEFTSGSFSVSETATEALVTLTRTGGADGLVSVDWSSSDLSATDGVDYSGGSGTIEFLDTEISKTLQILLNNDFEEEGDENFQLQLYNPQGGAAVGVTDIAVVTIVDDDVHGGWGPWEVSQACSVSCGGGKEEQTRHCNNDPPQGGGRLCELDDGSFDLTEVKEVDCNEDPCPIDGGWSDWSDWSACSVSCGGGYQTRQRTCDMDPPQHGGSECLKDDQTRGLSETGSQNCNQEECPIHGGWGPWEVTQACSVSCGGGTEEQTRHCINDPPQFGGDHCELNDGSFGLTEVKQVNCNEGPCAVDGGWSDWSDWSACSVSCGGGYRTRQRTCDMDPPQNGGQECLKDDQTRGLSETGSQNCNDQSCPAPTVVSVCDGEYGVGTTIGYSKEAGVGNCQQICAGHGLTCRLSIKLYPNPNRAPHLFNGYCTTAYSNGCCCNV